MFSDKAVTKMTDHLSIERLMSVAVREDFTFTAEESNHLKSCAACSGQWSDFLRDCERPDGIE